MVSRSGHHRRTPAQFARRSEGHIGPPTGNPPPRSREAGKNRPGPGQRLRWQLAHSGPQALRSGVPELAPRSWSHRGRIGAGFGFALRKTCGFPSQRSRVRGPSSASTPAAGWRATVVAPGQRRGVAQTSLVADGEASTLPPNQRRCQACRHQQPHRCMKHPIGEGVGLDPSHSRGTAASYPVAKTKPRDATGGQPRARPPARLWLA